jgi:hypothetical protein
MWSIMMPSVVIAVSAEHEGLARELELATPPDERPTIISDKGIDHYGELLQIFVPLTEIALSVIKFYLERVAEKHRRDPEKANDAGSQGEIVLSIKELRVELTRLSVDDAIALLESQKKSV